MARIAIVGSGIAGLTAAWKLGSLGHDVVLYEMRERPALLAHTASFDLAGEHYDIDSLLIWPGYHERLIGLLGEVGLSLRGREFSSGEFYADCDSQPYGGYRFVGVPGTSRTIPMPTGVGPRGLASLGRFWLKQQFRARGAFKSMVPELTCDAYFDMTPGSMYRKWVHPWANCSIGFPGDSTHRGLQARAFFDFFLTTDGRTPQMVAEGMSELARRLLTGCELRGGHEVTSVVGGEDSVCISGTHNDSSFSETFDQVVLAMPPKRIARVLDDAHTETWESFEERHIDIYLHTDPSVMPQSNPERWPLTLFRSPSNLDQRVEYTVWTSRIGGYNKDFFHSWNPLRAPEESQVLYHNKLLRVLPTAELQPWLRHELPRLQGQNRVWYAGTWSIPDRGSYLEEGVHSAQQVAQRIQETL